jgi:hypothetical protein
MKSPQNPKAFVLMASNFALPSKDLLDVMDSFIERQMRK